MSKINKDYLSKKYIDNAFSETIKNIKKDKRPFDNKKITLNVYADMLKKK